MKLNPYLSFNGNCEEALNFYKTSLNGEIVSTFYFESAQGMEVPESHKKKVMHSTFRLGENIFMACDTLPNNSYNVGNNISMSVDSPDFETMQKAFNAMASGGKITMPLQETFWGARFGTLTDKYGVHWMFNSGK